MLYDAVQSPLLVILSLALLMVVFLAGAASKLAAIETFSGVVNNYRLLPEFAVHPVSCLLPVAELAVGLGLAYPPARPYAAIGALLLLALFSFAIGVNLARGRREIDCGCFSAALRQHLSIWLIARNALLMGMAAWVAWGAPRAAIGSAGWSEWLIGLAAAVAVVVIYMSASALAAHSGAARNTRPAG